MDIIKKINSCLDEKNPNILRPHSLSDRKDNAFLKTIIKDLSSVISGKCPTANELSKVIDDFGKGKNTPQTDHVKQCPFCLKTVYHAKLSSDSRSETIPADFLNMLFIKAEAKLNDTSKSYNMYFFAAFVTGTALIIFVLKYFGIL